jgi:hypothetical protein
MVTEDGADEIGKEEASANKDTLNIQLRKRLVSIQRRKFQYSPKLWEGGNVWARSRVSLRELVHQEVIIQSCSDFFVVSRR